MKQTQRIKITTTHRRILRVRPALICAPCPICGCQVETLARMQAAEVLEVGRQTLDDLLAAGLIHAIPTVNVNLRVCKDSLFVQAGEMVCAAL